MLAQVSIVLNEDIHDGDATRSHSPGQSMTVVKDFDPCTDLSTRAKCKAYQLVIGYWRH